MYNKYAIFFHENQKYKVIYYIGSFMDDDLAKIVICSKYLKMKYTKCNREELENKLIASNLITYNDKEYMYGKYIKIRRMPVL